MTGKASETPRGGLESLMEFLFEGDLPVALQVFWKFLTLSMTVAVAYAAHETPGSLVPILLYVFAAIWVPVGIFTKLGD